ncbi:hypothetical protein PGTUg99_035947 [Puccinia graminis f. sp. tritici]|uniref:Uncharacterized protein n=1 Tax=Puccinia graminis f. sp. tritici TaxID=56615 RepID=A0A5B0RVS1_PUCGR|nr:hypothetical protein PGTUg99_035947 [Puccinia graminis f. sp. tritici]
MDKPLLNNEIAHDSFDPESDTSSISSAGKPDETSSNNSDDHESPRVASPPRSPDIPPTSVPSTLISSDISTSIILDTCRTRRPRAFITVAGDDIPSHYHQAINGMESKSLLGA